MWEIKYFCTILHEIIVLNRIMAQNMESEREMVKDSHLD